MSDETVMSVPGPDWIALARRLRREIATLTHDPEWYGDDFYAEALRRALRAEKAPHCPYESVDRATGLMTVANADHNRDSHTIIDRLNAGRAHEEAKAARDEVRRVYREARRDIAQALRDWCNERTVPAKLRREGVLLAADRICPAADLSH